MLLHDDYATMVTPYHAAMMAMRRYFHADVYYAATPLITAFSMPAAHAYAAMPPTRRLCCYAPRSG